MADEKKTQLSIVVRTVDQATAKIKAINDRLDAITKPFRDFRKQLSDLREKSGLDGVIDGFKGVGGAITDVLGKIAMIGGVAGAAVAGLLHIIDGFDELGDKAEAIGVNVDFLAQMRYAAEQSGASVEQLDAGLQSFTKNLGLARAGTGLMTKFLGTVSPALLKQLKAAKSNEEAFDLLAAAMKKIEDPAKRAAFAQKTLGDAALAPLFVRGADGVKALRDEYAKLAPGQGEAAEKAGAVDAAMKKLKAATDGVKAALVIGLGPAVEDIVKKMTTWLVGHQAEIAQWAKDIGEKLPGAIKEVVTWAGKAFDKVRDFVDMIGGLKGVAVAAGLVIAGPLISSVVSLTGALITAISRVAQLKGGLGGLGGVGGVGGVGGAAGAAAGGGAGAGGLALLGPVGFAIGTAALLNEATGGSIGDANGLGYFGTMEAAIKQRQAERAKPWEEAFAIRRPDMQARAAAATMDPQSFARAIADEMKSSTTINVKFDGAPRGTRVSADTQGTGGVDFMMGYQMGFGT